MEPLSAIDCDLASQYNNWSHLTLPSLFEQIAQKHPHRPAILASDREWTYEQLHRHSQKLAAAIIASGLSVGSRIAVVMANFPEFICVKMAIAQCGCVAVPINFQLLYDELFYVIDQSECAAVFTMAEFRGRDYIADFVDLLGKQNSLEFIVVREDRHDLPGNILSLADFSQRSNAKAIDQLLQRSAQLSPDSLSDIVFTSGTTGRPKGAMLTHDMLLRSAFSSALTRGFEDGRRIAFALPMYHVFGYVECWIAAMFVGGAIIPQTVFDAGELLTLAERFNATDCVCVPIMTHALLHEARQRGNFSAPLKSFFNSGGVNTPNIWQEIRDVLGVNEIHTAYGMTETTASTMCTRSDDTIDKLLETNGQYKLAGAAGDPEIEGKIALYRVVDPVTAKQIDHGMAGELQVKGPVVTRGYFRLPEETKAAFTDDGWFRTGDVGTLSADGYLTLTGRIKEVYRCGGEMVMPREIEALMEIYPGIAQALVIGVPDDRMGEVGCLCLVPESGTTLKEAEILSFCRDKLARFKVPKYVLELAVDDIPLTPTGRPQKFALAQLARRQLMLA